MSERRFDIVFSGELLPGFDAEQVAGNLASLFKATPETIARLMGGGTHVLKRNADEATALKYRQAMERAGARAGMRESGPEPTRPQPTTVAAAPMDAGTQIAGAGTASEPATTAAAPVAVDISLTPPGTAMLEEHERQHFEQRDVDTSHLKLASVFGTAGDQDRPAPPPPPDTSHMSIAAVGADLLADKRSVAPPPPPDTSAITLAEPGAPLADAAADMPLSVPDVSGISLAPPGAPLDEIRPKREAVNPDISALKLED